jgi:hypothetical protein
MEREITHRLHEPVFVISAKADDGGRDPVTKVDDAANAAAGVAPAVDVVAEEYDRIPGLDERGQLREQVLESRTIAVNVPDCIRRHSWFPLPGPGGVGRASLAT